MCRCQPRHNWLTRGLAREHALWNTSNPSHPKAYMSATGTYPTQASTYPQPLKLPHDTNPSEIKSPLAPQAHDLATAPGGWKPHDPHLDNRSAPQKKQRSHPTAPAISITALGKRRWKGCSPRPRENSNSMVVSEETGGGQAMEGVQSTSKHYFNYESPSGRINTRSSDKKRSLDQAEEGRSALSHDLR